MTRNEKKTAIENMAERFMNISDLEGKSMAIVLVIDTNKSTNDYGIDDGVVLDDSEYQRTGADRGGAAGDDTCGSGTESGNNRADSRGDRKQIQGFRWYVRGLGE